MSIELSPGDWTSQDTKTISKTQTDAATTVSPRVMKVELGGMMKTSAMNNSQKRNSWTPYTKRTTTYPCTYCALDGHRIYG